MGVNVYSAKSSSHSAPSAHMAICMPAGGDWWYVRTPAQHVRCAVSEQTPNRQDTVHADRHCGCSSFRRSWSQNHRYSEGSTACLLDPAFLIHQLLGRRTPRSSCRAQWWYAGSLGPGFSSLRAAGRHSDLLAHGFFALAPGSARPGCGRWIGRWHGPAGVERDEPSVRCRIAGLVRHSEDPAVVERVLTLVETVGVDENRRTL